MSQTATKVAHGLLALSGTGDWAERLPDGFVSTTETVLQAAGVRGFGPRMVRAATSKPMIAGYRAQDRMLVPGQFEAFGHRKIFVDEEVSAAIDQGARQVLVVGAGFDTLSLRLARRQPDVLFVEVDHPATSNAKAKGLTAAGAPENLVQIAADLGRTKLSTVLTDHVQWDRSIASVAIAEGLLQYLSDAQVLDLFGEVALAVPTGSRIVFTHAIPDERPHPIRSLLLKMVGEPWLSSVASEDLPAYLGSSSWTVISGVDTDEAHGIERYAVARRV